MQEVDSFEELIALGFAEVSKAHFLYNPKKERKLGIRISIALNNIRLTFSLCYNNIWNALLNVEDIEIAGVQFLIVRITAENSEFLGVLYEPEPIYYSTIRLINCNGAFLGMNIWGHLEMQDCTITEFRCGVYNNTRFRIISSSCTDFDLRHVEDDYNDTGSVIQDLKVEGSFFITSKILDNTDVTYLRVLSNCKINLKVIRILKKHFVDHGNSYDFLEIRAIEQRAILNSINNPLSSWKKFNEYFLLTMNKWSNEFGTNWARGVGFTLGWATLGAMGLYYMLYPGPYIYSEVDPKFWSLMFGGLSPLYKIDLLAEKGAGLGVYLWFLFYKIMVLYGLYQTVQAFRKHRK